MTENNQELFSEAKAHRHSFLLWKRRWDAFTPIVDLHWTEYAFNEEIADNIPEEPGVYAFCIRPNIGTNLNTSYLLYIGETTRTLRARYREYLREAYDPLGRALVYDFINMYRPYLTFCCAPLAEEISPKKIEDELLAAYIPPCNLKLPAEVRRVAQVAYR